MQSADAPALICIPEETQGQLPGRARSADRGVVADDAPFQTAQLLSELRFGMTPKANNDSFDVPSPVQHKGRHGHMWPRNGDTVAGHQREGDQVLMAGKGQNMLEHVHGLASRVEAIAIGLEAIAIRL